MEDNNKIIPLNTGIITKVSNLISITNKIIDEIILIPYRKGDKWGFCTPDKKIVIECQFDYVKFFEGNYAEGTINKEEIFVDRGGEYIKKESKNLESFKFENEYDEVDARFSNGVKKYKNYEISNAQVAVKKSNKFGFVNLKNETIIPFHYDWDSYPQLIKFNFFPIFKDGIVFLKKENKWGALDTNGEIIIPFLYESYGFHDFIDFTMEEGFIENFINVKFNDKWGIIDRNGKMIIPFEYDMCYHFFENLAVVKSNNKYGVIDKNNRLIVPSIYDKISNFKGGLAKIENNNKYGLIDNKGNLIVDIKYDTLLDYCLIELGYIVVGNNGKEGVIDINGEVVIDFIYEKVSPLNDCRFFVKKNNKWGIIDLNNKLLIDFKYDNIDRLNINNYSRVYKEKKLLGYIDKNGTEYWEN
jgi:hypothetical protein